MTHEEQASLKLRLALPADKPAGIRPMEAVWILLAIWLFVSYLESSDVSDQVIAERRSQIEGCISQYAAGERYAKPKKLECAPMVEAPAYVMTIPVGQ